MIDNIQLSNIYDSRVTVEVLKQFDFSQAALRNEFPIEYMMQLFDGNHYKMHGSTMSACCTIE